MVRVQGKKMQEERKVGTKAMKWEPISVLTQSRVYGGSEAIGVQNPTQVGKAGLGKEFDL